MVQAARSGWVMEQKNEFALQYQREIDRGERTVVGVNAFRFDEAAEIPYLRPDPEAQRRQAERVTALRRGRDADAAKKAWTALRDAAAGGENTVPYTIDAARNKVTLGEMYRAMRDVFGEVPADEKRYM
jgi:methylmalonyl-CoA mutase N-terminal domain/subunit